jgi:hypothetical protein
VSQLGQLVEHARAATFTDQDVLDTIATRPAGVAARIGRARALPGIQGEVLHVGGLGVDGLDVPVWLAGVVLQVAVSHLLPHGRERGIDPAAADVYASLRGELKGLYLVEDVVAA